MTQVSPQTRYAKVDKDGKVVSTSQGFSGVGLQEMLMGIKSLPLLADPKPAIDVADSRIEISYTTTASHVQESYTVVALTDEEKAAYLRSLKAEKIAPIAAIRYDIEVGGCVLNGVRVLTDRDSRNIMASTLMMMGTDETINWKGVDGWVQLTKAGLEAVATGIKAHVKACFDNEKALEDAINAATTADAVRAIDIHAGWPSNV